MTGVGIGGSAATAGGPVKGEECLVRALLTALSLHTSILVNPVHRSVREPLELSHS